MIRYMNLCANGLSFFGLPVLYSQYDRREVEILDSGRETILRTLASALSTNGAKENGWQETALFLVDLSLNVIVSEGSVREGETLGEETAGQKCYRVFHRRRAPCRKCATLETMRDGMPHTLFTETGGRKKRTRYRIDTFPIRDGAGKIWGVAERVFREMEKETLSKKEKEE
jgi:hypothetical protein